MSTVKPPPAPSTAKPVKLEGTLGRELVRQGTGSEHEAWVLETKAHGRLLLKKLGANPFELGKPPGPLGCTLVVEGYLRDNELRYATAKKR